MLARLGRRVPPPVKTCNDDSPFLGVGSAGVVAGECQLLDTRGILVSDDFPSLVRRDVEVLVSELGFGGRGVNGPRKALALGETGRLREVVDGLTLGVPGTESAAGEAFQTMTRRYSLCPGAASNIAADCGIAVSWDATNLPAARGTCRWPREGRF